MRWFIVLLGVSSIFGAIEHSVHFQLGEVFFNVIFFIMTALIFISSYFCFRAPYTLYLKNNKGSSFFLISTILILFLIFILCNAQRNFVLAEICGGTAILYSFCIHLSNYLRNEEKGSGIVALGIGISFLSFIGHAFRISLHEYFNHKDMAHVIMIVSMIVIYLGVYKTARGNDLSLNSI